VTSTLIDVFGLSEADAKARTLETHKEGRTTIGRFKLPVARDKVITVRSLARAQGFPLWVGLEDV
jgi:ATP-dependent Clp protease adapter protein ClpS